MKKRILFLGLILLGAPALAANITGVWANNGEDKVTRDELRVAQGQPGVVNSVWNGSQVNLFGGRNEVVSFNMVLEVPGNAAASGVSVSFNRLTGPGGSAIVAAPTSGNGVFDWTQRPIELFYVRYLQIKGLSRLSYEMYDERHVPRRLRRPGSSGGWTERPDHDKFYPDIAVPLELVPSFTVAARSNQSVWVDVYIPKGSAPGLYQGTLEVREGGTLVKSVPVRLDVRNFTLPDAPSAKTMLYYSSNNVNRRFLGANWVDPNSSAGARAKVIRDRHFLLAHRHKFSLIGDGPEDCGDVGDRPCPEWTPRLNGSLFTAANGYDGPGVNTGNNVYSIATYGHWGWKDQGQAGMNQHTDAWATWFAQNSPNTEAFLYLIDESGDTAQIETWARWIATNPGPGRAIKSMATLPLPTAASASPSLDIPTSTMDVGIASQWQPAADIYSQHSRKRFWMYNGKRPGTGSTGTEDDGVALRQRAWVQFKKRVNRWFFWETTYYNNYQGGTGETNVFQSAHTFGGKGTMNASLGETGWNYSNGDGVLLYPGTDTLFPADSYGVDGPFASLRLKYWRRGLQDVDYLTMAAAQNAGAVQTLVNTMVPKALWEYGVSDPNDPTWVLADISWTDDPTTWENARRQLADMLSGPILPPPLPGAPTFAPPAVVGLDGQVTATPPSGFTIASYNWSVAPATGSATPINRATAAGTLALEPLALAPGDYRISVTVTDSNGNVSPATTRTVTLTGGEAPPPPPAPRQARVYPNPWRSNRHSGLPITFEQPMDEFSVDILSAFTGRRIKTLTTSDGTAEWNLTNESGNRVSSGSYIYLIRAAGVRTIRGRLAILR